MQNLPDTWASRGALSLSAQKDININTAIEFRDYGWSYSKRGWFKSKSVSHYEADITHIGSNLEGKSITLSSGADLSITGSSLTAHDNITLDAKDEVLLASVADSRYSETFSKRCSFFCLIGSSSHSISSSLTNKGSLADASANFASRSGSSTTIIASQINAGGDLSIDVGVGPGAKEGASINILSASDREYSYLKETESSLFDFSGDTLWLYKKEETESTNEVITNVASTLQSGGNMTLNATTDINIAGSTINGAVLGGFVELNAGRDINIVAGRESVHESTHTKVAGIGVEISATNSSVSLFGGYMATEDRFSFDGSYSAASLISSGGDLAMLAGRDIALVGSDVTGTGDVALTAGRDIITLSSSESEILSEFHKSLRIGITASVSSAGAAAVESAISAASRFGTGKGSGSLATDLLAAARLHEVVTGYGQSIQKAYVDGGRTEAAKQAAGIGFDVSFGVSASQSSRKSVSETQRLSSIYSGGDLTLSADRDISFTGTQVRAEGDASVTAGRNFELISVQDTSGVKGSSSSFGASVSLTGQGGSVSLSGSREKGASAFTNPSLLTSGGDLTIDVGATTKLLGSLIASDTDDLSLSTGDLIFTDLYDGARYDRRGGSISVGTGGATLGVDIARSVTEGVTRATVGAGEITIRDLTPEQQLERLALLNRDVDRFQEITRQSEFALNFELSDKTIRKAFEGLQSFGEALRNIADLLKTRKDITADEAESGLAVYNELKRRGVTPEDIRGCSGRQGSIWDWFITPAHADDICGVILDTFGQDGIDSCLKLWDAAIHGAASTTAQAMDELEAAYERDPDGFDKLLYILGGPTEWLTDYLIPDDPERDEDIKQMAREGAQFIADYLDSLEQKVQNGSLDREEAIALAAVATLTILKSTPKSKRAALLKKLNAPIKRLTARFKGTNKVPRFISRADGQTLDTSKIYVPGPTNSRYGKMDYLLGKTGSPDSIGKGGYFGGELGFRSGDKLSAVMQSHLKNNFGSAVIKGNKVEVTAPITGPNGVIRNVKAIWQVKPDGKVGFVTALPGPHL